MRIASPVWESKEAWAMLTRAVLAPASALYGGVTRLRNALYDRGTLRSVKAPIPVLSVGNLAVGGTGKTPVSAWIVSELKARGANPAMVLRGYGNDEPRVHALLNPGVPVFANADRLAAARDAAAGGADVAVLDDAFQHRRIARIEDIVLVSADRWREPVRLLPSGPWRESPRALARASLVMVTRKAVGRDDAASLMNRLAPLTRTGLGAVMALDPGDLCDVVTGAARALSVIGGARVLVAAGIADPESFGAQLVSAGAHVAIRRFPDHHSYTFPDVRRLADEAHSFDLVVCTLKDAVKLGPQWPREAPSLWYVSLRCRIESGGAAVSAMLDRVIAARSTQLR